MQSVFNQDICDSDTEENKLKGRFVLLTHSGMHADAYIHVYMLIVHVYMLIVHVALCYVHVHTCTYVQPYQLLPFTSLYVVCFSPFSVQVLATHPSLSECSHLLTIQWLLDFPTSQVSAWCTYIRMYVCDLLSFVAPTSRINPNSDSRKNFLINCCQNFGST